MLAGELPARWRCASTKIAHPDPKRRNALLRRPATPTSSAGTALSRSGPRKRAVRWNEPSLLRTTPLPASATQGRKSGTRVEVRRYFARFIMVFLPSSDVQMAGDAQMPTHHIDAPRATLARPSPSEMPDRPSPPPDQH